MTEDWSDWDPQLKTLLKMLRYRQYSSVRQLMQGSNPLLVCAARDPPGELIMCYFVKEAKVGVKTLRLIREQCAEAECSHAILVTMDGLTPFACKELDETARGGDVVEIFRRKELAFCVVEHELVPAHSLVEGGERRALLQRLGFKPAAFPKLRSTDPVARFLHFPVGAIVKIQRSIGSTESETYYRVVVP